MTERREEATRRAVDKLGTSMRMVADKAPLSVLKTVEVVIHEAGTDHPNCLANRFFNVSKTTLLSVVLAYASMSSNSIMIPFFIRKAALCLSCSSSESTLNTVTSNRFNRFDKSFAFADVVCTVCCSSSSRAAFNSCSAWVKFFQSDAALSRESTSTLEVFKRVIKSDAN